MTVVFNFAPEHDMGPTQKRPGGRLLVVPLMPGPVSGLRHHVVGVR
jgi:hypothetical protein